MVAPVAPLSLTVKASLSSKVVSAHHWTVMVLLGSLGAKVIVPICPTTSGIYTLSLHDALPILAVPSTVVKPTVTDWVVAPVLVTVKVKAVVPPVLPSAYRKSTRVNFSDVKTLYAVFGLV